MTAHFITVYKSCAKPAILYGSKAWCLKESNIGISQRTEEIHGDSNVWSRAKKIDRSMNLMLMLGLNETIDQLAMANSVRWYGDVLRRIVMS